MSESERKEIIKLVFNAMKPKIEDYTHNLFAVDAPKLFYPIAELVFKDACEKILELDPNADIIYKQQEIFKIVQTGLQGILSLLQMNLQNNGKDPVQLKYNEHTLAVFHQHPT